MAKERTIIVILAFDQASSVTGWAVLSNEKLIDHGVIKVKSYHTTPDERIMEMFCKIREVMETFEPDAVVMEDVAKQKNVYSLIRLARVQGAMMEMCREMGIGTLDIVKPSIWRESLHFKQGRTERKELKRQAQAFVKDKYGIDVCEDEADAICIGEYYIISKEDKA